MEGYINQENQEEILKEEEIVPQDDKPRCLMCKRVVFTQDMVGGDIKFAEPHLVMTAMNRDDKLSTFYFCDKCRFTPGLLMDFQRNIQDIIFKTDFKVIHGKHN